MDNEKDFRWNKVYTFIGNDPNELDLAIIHKECGKGVIIGKLKTEVIIVDIELINAYNGDEVTVLNYKNFSNTNEAYDKMMRWIGKLCKKSTESRYFRKSDPYKRVPLNTGIYNENMIKYIKDNIPA